MHPFIGEMAALAAAAGFSVTSVCYTLAGRKISSVTAIALSLPLSWLVMALLHRLTLGELFPAHAAPERWLTLGASGVLAFVVSSYFMLNAYQRIGPRLAMLVASFAPVLGALLAWLFLGQTLPANAAVGIVIVLAGILWVVAERGRGRGGGGSAEPVRRRGVADAALGTLAQAAAFVFASQGVAGGFAPLSAALMRVTAGMVALWLYLGLAGRGRATAAVLAGEARLLLLLGGAALSGPVLSGSLLLLSLQHIPVGVATTLSHTTAVLLIPIGYVVFKERITLRAVVGTVVTVAGIALLFA